MEADKFSSGEETFSDTAFTDAVPAFSAERPVTGEAGSSPSAVLALCPSTAVLARICGPEGEKVTSCCFVPRSGTAVVALFAPFHPGARSDEPGNAV
jgi:hypothetical protein